MLETRSKTITRKLPAADRRRQIIEVAMALFSAKGFEGTTTREISKAAGVSEAIIFRHFATKDRRIERRTVSPATSEDRRHVAE